MEGWLKLQFEACNTYFDDVYSSGLSADIDKIESIPVIPVFVRHLYENMVWEVNNK